MTRDTYDLVVIGSGPAGENSVRLPLFISVGYTCTPSGKSKRRTALFDPDPSWSAVR